MFVLSDYLNVNHDPDNKCTSYILHLTYQEMAFQLNLHYRFQSLVQITTQSNLFEGRNWVNTWQNKDKTEMLHLFFRAVDDTGIFLYRISWWMTICVIGWFITWKHLLPAGRRGQPYITSTASMLPSSGARKYSSKLAQTLVSLVTNSVCFVGEVNVMT